MLFLQILAFVAVVVLSVWILGVGLVSVFLPKANTLGGNILIGIPLAALAIWLPFAFGWIIV